MKSIVNGLSLFNFATLCALAFSTQVAKAANKQWPAAAGIVSYLMEEQAPMVTVPEQLLTSRTGASNSLNWQGNTGYSYKIEQSINGQGFKQIAVTTETSIEVQAPVNNRYRYRVAACLTHNSENICSL